MGRETFRLCRPKNVRRLSESSRTVCLCVICQNIGLKVSAVNKSGYKTVKSDILKRLTCERDGKELPARRCIDEKCEACGPDQLRKSYVEFEMDDKEITWDHWEYVNVEHKGQQIRKIKVISRTGPRKEFMDQFEKDLKGYAAHRFRATWQQNALKCA